MSADKFFEHIELLRCPFCGTAFSRCGSSLRCKNGHAFDPSRRGYVNFAPNAAPSRYDQTLFTARRSILEGGFYNRIVETIKQYVPESSVVLDAGCGDGTFTKALKSDTTIGLDLSKDAIRLAASGGGTVLWMVGDLTRIPLRDASADVILNLFSPAHYTEFARVLKPDGRLLKLVPQEGYLKEIRVRMGDRLRKERYSNDSVVTHLSERFQLSQRVRLTDSFSLNRQQATEFLRMTPLTFGVNAEELEPEKLNEITIDVEFLIGHV